MASGVLFRAFRSTPQPFTPTTYSGIIRCMSSSDISSQKVAARKAAIAALRLLTASEMVQESAAITDQLHATGMVHAAKRMAIYVHCPKLREVDTTPVLLESLERQNARVYVPRVLDKDANMHFLHINTLNELETVPPFGIREPTVEYADGSKREDINEIIAPVDLVVMPGLAFTEDGKRLGRGGGYYDKFLAKCYERAAENGWSPPLLVALAFRAQFMEDVPCDEHDQPVDIIVSADGVRYVTADSRKRAEELVAAVNQQ